MTTSESHSLYLSATN